MSTGLKANSDGSAAIQVGGTDVITLTSGGAATFVTSPTTVQAGTAAAPSITFSGDTNTGIYSPGADTIAFTEGGVESMRITSAGDVGIGTTSPGRKLDVVAIPAAANQLNGMRLQMNGVATSLAEVLLGTDGGGIPFTSLRTGNDSNSYVTFFTGSGPTERARIDSAGIFKLSATGLNSSSAYFYQTSPAFNSGSSSKYSYYSDSGTKNFGIGFLSDVNGSQAAWMTANSTDLGWVLQTNSANGVRLANTATSWSSYSDERLKNIIEEIPQALSKVSSIRAVRFSWKDDESNAPRVGVIAQDVQAVLPEVVDDDTDYMQVRYSELVPLCIKAIQEQQAMIDELKAKVAALEGA